MVCGHFGQALDGERESVGQVKRDRLRRRRRLLRLRRVNGREPDARSRRGQQTLARGRLLLHGADHWQLDESGGRGRLMVQLVLWLQLVLLLLLLLVVMVQLKLVLLVLLVVVVQLVLEVLLVGGGQSGGHGRLLRQRVRRETVTHGRVGRGLRADHGVVVRRGHHRAAATTSTVSDTAPPTGHEATTADATRARAATADHRGGTVVVRCLRAADQTVVMVMMVAHPRPTADGAQAHARFFHNN